MKLIIFLIYFFVTTLKSAFLEIQLTESGPGMLRPVQNLSLVCKVSGFSISTQNYHWHWIRQPPGKGLEWIGNIYVYHTVKHYASSFQSRATISADSSTNQVSLQLNSVTAADMAVYYCYREGSYGYFDYWGSGTLVTVTTASQSAPSVFPLIVPSESIPNSGLITIGCLAKDVMPSVASYAWNDQNNVSINANYIKQLPSVFGPSGTFTSSSYVTISANDWRDFQPSYCKATNSAGTGVVRVIRQTSCIQPTVIIRAPRLEDFENSDPNATIVCLADNLQTANITIQWLKNGRALDSGIANTGPVAVGPNGYSIISHLTVDRRDWASDKTFSCEVHNQNFTSIVNISRSLVCDAGCGPEVPVHVETIPPTFTDIYITKSAKLTCRVSNMPYDQNLKELDVIWTRKRDNKQLETIIGQAKAQENNEMIYVDATATVCPEEWDSGDTFICKVAIPSLLPTAETRTLRKVKDSSYHAPAVYVLPPPSEQLVLQEMATVTCLVKGYQPNDLFLKWLRNDEPINDSEYFTSEPIQESKTPERYVTYSMLNVKEQDWSSGTTYTCLVGHEALPLQTTQKTVDKKTGIPTLVNVSLVLSETAKTCY